MQTNEERNRLRFLYVKHHSSSQHISLSEEEELLNLVKTADLSKKHTCWMCKCSSTLKENPAIALTGLLCRDHTIYHLKNDVDRFENPILHLNLQEYSDDDILVHTNASTSFVPETGC